MTGAMLAILMALVLGTGLLVGHSPMTSSRSAHPATGAGGALVATAPVGGGADPPLVVTVRARTPAFRPVVKPVKRRHVKYSWVPGCPVGPAQLRRLRIGYVGFDGAHHRGTLVVAAGAVPAVRKAFRAAYRAGFPIRTIRPVDRYYGGSRAGMARSDARSMAADNTSAFNCRYATGSSRLSRHAWGDAVDVNPRENPHVLGGRTYPGNGAAYADRSPLRAGMLDGRSALTAAFRAKGWTWGGTYSAPDYQHFSRTGA